MNYLKSFYSSSPSLIIKLKRNKHNFYQYISKDNKVFSYPTYFDNDKISGEIELNLNNNKSIIINSLSICLIGILHNEKLNLSETIFQDIIEIIDQNNPINIINKITNFNFCFQPKNKPYETYLGNYTQITYYLNVIGNMIIDDNVSKIEKKLEICCLKPTPKKICDEFYLNKDNNKNKNINIGIENVIHVNINLLKSNYFMDDVIVGKIKIIKSELQLNGIFLEIKKEEKINLEKNNCKKLFNLKEEEINKKNKELQNLRNNNQRLKINLQKLQVETNKRLDKIEMKEKNELYEKEKEKRQTSLEQLLQVKEREIVNSIQIVEKKKKKMKNLETILEKNVDMSQINNLYYKIKIAKHELSNLKNEKESLEKIKEEHYECQKNIENLLEEIEKLKGELRTAQLENRNREQEERKNAIYNINNYAENNIGSKKVRVTKSSELPLINRNQEIKKEKEKEKELDMEEINEYLKKIDDIEKEKAIMNKRLNMKKLKMNEEKENIEQKSVACDEQIKELENKNKLLIIQIEEQKIEMKELYDKLIERMKSAENKKKLLEEKEEENKKYIQQVKSQKK